MPVDHNALASQLVPMDSFDAEPIKIDLVYASANHPENIFKTPIYHESARLSLHKDMTKIVIGAARAIYRDHQFILILKDGLRTVDAEIAITKTQAYINNPQWYEGPDILLSKAGTGAHPRGMAIDVSLETKDGRPVDMGTVFDEMIAQSARDYKNFAPHILKNRYILEHAFVHQAEKLNLPLLPLPAEWWDFRFPRSYYEQWQPLYDADIPPSLRMIAPQQKYHGNDWEERFDKNVKDVLNPL
jgi:D-alanyl-D-alanine dipeptidase